MDTLENLFNNKSPSSVVDSSSIDSHLLNHQDPSGDIVTFKSISSSYTNVSKLYETAKSFVPDTTPPSMTKIWLADKKVHPAPLNTNDVPTKNRPTVSPYAVGECSVQSAHGKNNILTLEHTCDFTIDLKAEACGVTFAAIQSAFKLTILKKIEMFALSKLPFIAYIKNLFETIKAWYDYIMKYVNMIKKFIQCILDIMRAIKSFIDQLMALPAHILGQVLGCISGIQNMIVGAVFRAKDAIIEDLTGMTPGEISGVVNTVQNISSNMSSYTDSVKSDFTGQVDSFKSIDFKTIVPTEQINKLSSSSTYTDPITNRFNLTPMQLITQP